VVTICTTSLTFNNSTFCPHSVFMCFVWIWEQTAIISLYSINWLVLGVLYEIKKTDSEDQVRPSVRPSCRLSHGISYWTVCCLFMLNSIQEFSTKFVEEAWVLWQSAQCKPQSTFGCQWVPIRAFHNHFPVWVNFGTKYRHMMPFDTTGTGKTVLFWWGEPWNHVTFWK